MTEPGRPGALPVGLVGHGRWGEKVARALPDAGAELAAVAVGTEASAAGLREKQAARLVTTDVGELLADPAVEAVVIATPAPTHEGLAREALAAGKDLFVEKPLCLGAGDALELEALARDTGLVLMTGHVFLYHPALTGLKHLVDEGTIGPVESVKASWLNTSPHPADGSVLWSLGPHPLSIIAWLCGTEGVEVSATGNEDRMEVGLSREDGWHGEVAIAWYAPQRERSLTVLGTNGTAHFDGESGELVVAVGDAPPEPVPCSTEPALTAELRAFVEAVRSRQAPDQEGVTAAVTSWLEQAAG